MQLHLTSRKRKAQHGTGDDEDDVFVLNESLTHNHNDDVFGRVYSTVLQMAVQAVVSTDKHGFVYCSRTNSNLFLRVQPYDLGVSNASAGFYCPAEAKSLYSIDTRYTWDAGDEYNAIHYTKTKMEMSRTDNTLYKKDDMLLSVCSTALLLPAMISSVRGTNVYSESITSLELMMTNTDPYATGDNSIDTDSEPIEVLRLFPVRTERMNTKYDFIFDFDTSEGWCVGGTPTINTDAAAAAHLYVSRLV